MECVDPDTGQLVAARITAIRTAERECVQLGFADGELTATSDHPLYCPQTRQWAPAGDWALGKRTQLLRVEAEGVTPVVLGRTSTFAGIHQVFDLTVDHPLHNFVANGVLVHNKSAPRTCAVETIAVRAQTTCGPVADLGVSLDTSCNVSVSGADIAGLPAAGTSNSLTHGFDLQGFRPDSGFTRQCDATPTDGGFAISCASICPPVPCDGGTSMNCTVRKLPDGGEDKQCVAVCSVDDCEPKCSGTLTQK